MNWLIITSNIALASVAALLSVLSWKTMKNIRHLNVGKSFWIPAFLSSLFFATASIATIINESVLPLTSIVESSQILQLTAICSLFVGIYSYTRTIKKNLPKEFIVPEANSPQNGKIETYIASPCSSNKKKSTSKNSGTKLYSECKQYLGYLETIPANESPPEECLSCDKILECKHPESI